MKSKKSEKQLIIKYNQLTKQVRKDIVSLKEYEKPVFKLALINFIKSL